MIETTRVTTGAGLFTSAGIKGASSQGDFAALLPSDTAEAAATPATASYGVLSTFCGLANAATTANELAPIEMVDPKQAMADLRELLKDRFSAAGIDMSQPVTMTVASNGSIKVTSDHPDAAKIEALFAADPDLANAYRGVVSTVDLAARGKVATTFSDDWEEADDDKERKEVWRRETSMMSQLDSVSGQMTMDADGLTSASMRMASSLCGGTLLG